MDLGGIRDRLDEKDEVREEALRSSREIRRLSTSAISDVHGGDFEAAVAKLEEAEERLDGVSR
ncbi:MAG: hypothetical protein MAG715_00265 [Methanonatronarchaeales archaeon]|nr:hypothetical protein [Methanonatronarchaeales archaeon]